MLRYVSQSYKTIKATGEECRDGFVKAIKATGGGCREIFLKDTRLSRLEEGDTGIGFSRLQGYQGYWRGTQGKVSQGYKAIKATGEVSRYRFLKATRLSRLQEGDTWICLSRLQGYQGYRRGMQGWVSQGYKAIKATGGGHGD